METATPALRRVARCLMLMDVLAVDENIEQRLQEIKQQFLSNIKNSPPLKNLRGEELWEEIRESIRRDMVRNPLEWRD